jgi:hypothetical protein
MEMSQPSNYQSYLVRLWRDHPRAPWQASLQSTASEQVYYFAEVEQMWAYLKAQMAGEEDDLETGHIPPTAPY